MIDKEEAAMLVEGCKINIKKSWGTTEKALAGAINSELERAARAIRSMDEDGWIPTEYEVPVDEGMKLVTCRTQKGQLSVNRAYYHNGFWHGAGSMSGVIAWLDMPEPYRGGENGNE